jgi:hypothetical protein
MDTALLERAKEYAPWRCYREDIWTKIESGIIDDNWCRLLKDHIDTLDKLDSMNVGMSGDYISNHSTTLKIMVSCVETEEADVVPIVDDMFAKMKNPLYCNIVLLMLGYDSCREIVVRICSKTTISRFIKEEFVIIYNKVVPSTQT